MIPQRLQEILTYIRRIIKMPNPQDVSDETLLDYINRFFIYDMPYKIQILTLKTTYSFETTPNIDRYNFPINEYTNILPPVTIDGYSIRLCQSRSQFIDLFPSLFNNQSKATGDGATSSFSFTLTAPPVVRGHRGIPINQDTASTGTVDPQVYISGIDTSGTRLLLSDDGEGSLTGDGTGTVDYITGDVTANFSSNIADGEDVYAQSISYQAGRPQLVLFYDNVFTLRPVPDRTYEIKMDAYLTPTSFLIGNINSDLSLQWIADYLAKGAARKILQDFGDSELLQIVNPLYREAENMVLRRADRQRSNEKTATIFDLQTNIQPYIYNPF